MLHGGESGSDGDDVSLAPRRFLARITRLLIAASQDFRRVDPWKLVEALRAAENASSFSSNGCFHRAERRTRTLLTLWRSLVHAAFRVFATTSAPSSSSSSSSSSDNFWDVVFGAFLAIQAKGFADGGLVAVGGNSSSSSSNSSSGSSTNETQGSVNDASLRRR
ncbi:MAG: hypothetical protein VXZ18_19420, partial [Pseudomonadota bacterium]|nr:hypothetical protein [Pseudomonadota bacterium]